ncbi:hypothetical protein C1646_762451 [Rhizophagus diaphanus]|nr:hypothetical protein C1646_762451 [Rhizophagus diaphanus] [Rhizophagus sp. MUCL 43196]
MLRKGTITTSSASCVTEVNFYATIVGSDWLKKAKAITDYETDELTFKLERKNLTTSTSY